MLREIGALFQLWPRIDYRDLDYIEKAERYFYFQMGYLPEYVKDNRRELAKFNHPQHGYLLFESDLWPGMARGEVAIVLHASVGANRGKIVKPYLVTSQGQNQGLMVTIDAKRLKAYCYGNRSEDMLGRFGDLFLPAALLYRQLPESQRGPFERGWEISSADLKKNYISTLDVKTKPRIILGYNPGVIR